MTGSEYWDRMVDLEEEESWTELECLLEQDHPLLPGEKEVFLVLMAHSQELGHQLALQLDASGLRVVKKNSCISGSLK